MPIDLYYMPDSSPCNSVILTAAALGVELNLKFLDLNKNEQLTEEFIKINPTHTIPTIVDNGFVLWESRAILIYLVEKYGKDDSLYPKDLQKRAVVNQRIFFDMGSLYQRFADYFYPQLFSKQPANADNFKRIEQSLEFLNSFLEGNTYVAGEQLTIADITLIASLFSYSVANVKLDAYPNVTRWLAHCKKSVPGWSTAEKNMEEFKVYFDVLKK